MAEPFWTRLMPALDAAAVSLRERFPDVRISTEHHPVGSRTALQGYMVAISCLLPDREPDAADVLDVEIDAVHLSTAPVISGAYVCWGHPNGYPEADLVDTPFPMDEAGLQRVDAMVPALVKAVAKGLRRGHPPDQVG